MHSRPAGRKQAAGNGNRIDSGENCFSAVLDGIAHREDYKDHAVPAPKVRDSSEISANFSTENRKSIWRTDRRYCGGQTTDQNAQDNVDYNFPSSNYTTIPQNQKPHFG